MEEEVFINRSAMYFGGTNVTPDKTPFTIIGVPFDSTSSFMPGSRFAPSRIRIASAGIEFFSFRTRFDMDRVLFNDVGDLEVVIGDVRETLRRLEMAVRMISSKGRIPIIIGGEHIITLGAIRALLEKNIGVIVFDAHLDLRSNYLGLELSHATVTRRILDLLGFKKVIIVGVRAVSEEEYEYARKKGISYITSYWINKYGLMETVKKLRKFLEEFENVYISIDLDVIDPAYAPGVGNPEPEGITPTILLDTLFMTLENNVVGFDVTEVCPLRDVNDVTSILAAKIIVELASIIYTRLKS